MIESKIGTDSRIDVIVFNLWAFLAFFHEKKDRAIYKYVFARWSEGRAAAIAIANRIAIVAS